MNKTNTLPEIINKTPETVITATRKLDENGNIILERNAEGVIQIYLSDCIYYGKNTRCFLDGSINTIGLLDGSKITEKEWQDLRKVFDLIDENGNSTRHYCVGGSDSGTILGYNPYKTAKDLYLTKRSFSSEEIPLATQYKFAYGHINEELIARGFSAKTGLPVYKDSTVYFNIRTGFMQANVDFFTESKRGLHILEIKTTNSNNLDEWKNKQVPLTYYTQAVGHYPRVLEDLPIVGTYFCCGYSNNLDDLIIRRFDKHPECEDMVEDAEKNFMNYVIKGYEPPYFDYDSSEAILNSIMARFPKAENKETCELPEEFFAESVMKYYELNSERAALEKKAREIKKESEKYKAPLMEFIGANAYGIIEIEGVTYKIDASNNNPKFSIPSTQLPILEANEPDIYEQYVSVSETRKFSIKPVVKKG